MSAPELSTTMQEALEYYGHPRRSYLAVSRPQRGTAIALFRRKLLHAGYDPSLTELGWQQLRELARQSEINQGSRVRLLCEVHGRYGIVHAMNRQDQSAVIEWPQLKTSTVAPIAELFKLDSPSNWTAPTVPPRAQKTSQMPGAELLPPYASAVLAAVVALEQTDHSRATEVKLDFPRAIELASSLIDGDIVPAGITAQGINRLMELVDELGVSLED
jgi:hypothetical protein